MCDYLYLIYEGVYAECIERIFIFKTVSLHLYLIWTNADVKAKKSRTHSIIYDYYYYG